MSELSQLCLDVSILSAAGGAQAAYLSIPAHSLRSFCDSCFPGLAHNPIADSASGAGHRWREGHDMIMDIIRDFWQAPGAKIQQAGHILLTDFPTKAGIPIPGFSASGFGQMLADLGIPKGYMCINVMDAGIGILAISDASSDLMAAFAGMLPMNCWSAFDTFGFGAVELISGISLQNPLLIAAGAENIMAGVVSTVKTYSYHVAPEAFFGSSLTGFLIGCGISLLLNHDEPLRDKAKYAAQAGGKAAVLGALSSISTYFSLGAGLAFVAFELGKRAGLNSNAVPVTDEIFEQRLQHYLQDPAFASLWNNFTQDTLQPDNSMITVWLNQLSSLSLTPSHPCISGLPILAPDYHAVEQELKAVSSQVFAINRSTLTP